MRLEQNILEIDGEKIFCETLVRRDNVVILHGAGGSSRKRFHVLAEAILRRGIGVVLFDFSSHGDSTGERESLSLNRRNIQAQKVIETFIPQGGNIYLAGFSMSGQTVCDLLPFYKERVSAILLGCPAVYASLAQDLSFGSEFTATIRNPGSWKTSAAFDSLQAFKGRTVIAIGSDDRVIPGEIVTALRRSARHPVYVEYSGVDHQLAVWLAAHESEQEKLLDLFFDEYYDMA